MSPQVSWLFFKAVRAGLAVKRPYLAHSTRCRLLRAFDAVPHVARVTCIRCICVGWFAMSKRQRVEWIHTGRASNAEKQPTARGPEGCVENGPARETYRRVGVCKASSTPSRAHDHYSGVEKQSYFPRRRYANTPTCRHASPAGGPF